MMDMSPSLRPPKAPSEEQQYGENFETSHQHVERKQPFGEVGDVVESTARSGDARARAIVAKAGQERHASFLYSHPHGGKQHEVDHEQNDE